MALFVNTAELKNQTNKILRRVKKGPVVVTRRGHPCAVLIATKETDLEDLLWELTPSVQAKIRKGMQEMLEGNTIPASEFFRKHG